jgi:uncharacterized membrane protein YdjX (TVP38/TMEM64 family)
MAFNMDIEMSLGRYRLGLFVLVVLGLWITAWATGLTARFTPESIRGYLAGGGLWRVVAFTVLFSTGQLLLRVPSPVFVAAAVAVYGRNLGLLVALLGILVSVTVSFAVVRTFAGRALADVQRPFVRRLLSKVDSHPVMTVALLRLIFQAAPPLNYALPMTAVRWRDHLVGSMLGLPVPVTVMALFFDWFLHRAA